MQLMRMLQLIAYTCAFSVATIKRLHKVQKCIFIHAPAHTRTLTERLNQNPALSALSAFLYRLDTAVIPPPLAGPPGTPPIRVIRTAFFVQFFQCLRGV